MYIVIDLLGDEETIVSGETAEQKATGVHEQLVKWEDLEPEPALQILET